MDFLKWFASILLPKLKGNLTGVSFQTPPRKVITETPYIEYGNDEIII